MFRGFTLKFYNAMQLLIIQQTVQCEYMQFLPEVLKCSGAVHSSRMQMPSSLLGRQEFIRIKSL